MVFATLALYAGRKPPMDSFWRKRKIFRLSAHFGGRRWNCYSLALRMVHRSMVNTFKSRKLKKEEAKELWETRLGAAAEEHGLNFKSLHYGLLNSNILLNKRVLTDLAIWEPKTFKSLTKIAWNRAAADRFYAVTSLGEPPDGVITRGMLK